MKRFLAGSAFALLCASANSALAFSGPARFSLDPLSAGGGGRYFTGSIYDGYTCKVCHQGGLEPSAQIRGLPEAGYVPGTTYDIQIAWANPEISHAMMLELVGSTGKPVREIALANEPSRYERCNQAVDGEVAASLEEVDERRIISVSECKSASARFRFTAPQDAEVTLSLAMVRTDSSGTSEGDGVLEVTHTLRRADLPQGQAGGCSAHGGVRHRAVLLLAWVMTMTWLLTRRRRSQA